MRLLGALRELEAATTAERLQVNKNYFDSLKALSQQYLDNFKTLASRLKALDEEIYNTRKEGARAVRDLLRESMTEEEAFYDKKRELAQLDREASKAVALGNCDEARDFYKDAIALAKELAKEAPEEDRIGWVQRLQELYGELGTVQESERAKVKKAAEEQLEAYQRVGSELERLSVVLEGLVKDQEVLLKVSIDADSLNSVISTIMEAVEGATEAAKEIKVGVDSNSLSSAVDSVRNAFSGLTISVDVVANGARGYSSGGLIKGPGSSTSDSILLWASNDEYILKARAVRRYGLGFINALNEELINPYSVPRFRDGGLVTTSGAGNISEPASVQRDMVTVVLKDGSDVVELEGDRASAAKFVRTMRRVGRGRG